MLPEYLYAASSTGEVLAFSILNGSGTLTPINSLTGPLPSASLAAVNNQFVYASDPLHAQLYGYSIDQTTGALSPLTGSPFSTAPFSIPQGLASPAGSSCLYVADSGKVDAFTVSSTGVPSVISGSPFPSGTNLFLTTDPSGEFVYSSIDDAPGGIFGFTISSNGALTEISGSPFPVPGQTVSNSQPSGIVTNGPFVYAALMGSNQIAAFSVDSSTGFLTPVPGSPFPAGSEPTVLVLANNYLYAINSIEGTISGYSVNSTTGVLTAVAGSPFAISGAAMASDSLGIYLYVWGGSGIQAFSIDTASGNLTPVSGSPFAASQVTALTVASVP